MAKIVVVGCGSAGVRVAESLQDKMPEAGFVAVGHFDKGETPSIPHRINTKIKRRLSDDELMRHQRIITHRFKKRELPRDSYWWWTCEYTRGRDDCFYGGIALVRDEDIVGKINVDDAAMLRFMSDPPAYRVKYVFTNLE